MKKIILLLSIVLLVSCNDKSNDPMPEKKKLAAVLTVVYNPDVEISKPVTVLLTRDDRVDTLHLANYPGVFNYFPVTQYGKVIFSSDSDISVFLKDDDGSISKDKTYKEYTNVKSAEFDINEVL